MNSNTRKRFRAEIDNSYVKEMFARKRPKQPTAQAQQDDEPLESIVTTIPSEMLPQSKFGLTKQKQRDQQRDPDHWIKPPEKVKLSREQVLREERNCIEKKIGEQQAWSRTARSLITVINPAQKSALTGVDIEGDEIPPNPSIDGVERKNYSREFLQTFFKKADSIAAEKKRQKKPPKLAKLVPKLASGIRPDADEIAL